MKRLPLTIAFILACVASLTSCLDKNNDTSDEYADWRKANLEWFEQQKSVTDAAGNKFYKVVTADWDPSASVLMHWFNDTNATRGNIKPLFTSQVDVKYRGELYDGTPFDSSYLNTSPADSLFRCRLNSDIIEGWALAVTNMRIGDSVRVVIPYSLAYKASSRGTVKPYSMLEFDIKLVAVPKFELTPRR